MSESPPPAGDPPPITIPDAWVKWMATAALILALVALVVAVAGI